jgi:UDP-glucose 4-epimerase
VTSTVGASDGPGRRVLITGIAGTLAGRFALRLEADERVEYVGGVDLTGALPRAAPHRVRPRRPAQPAGGKVVESTRVDTIVHLAITSEPAPSAGRSRMKELNVIGTMQLLAAAQKAPRVRNLVLRSTTAVYGSHYADPALFREDVSRHGAPAAATRRTSSRSRATRGPSAGAVPTST